ncbi:synaptic vesicle 2-related protein isoform X1 [Coregonus clupeaformis]|uniref:synaptic vesicle 2-related protein isoform X1 n=1 Tax=Coregonus clupeaformis TaxID=59861 RepID=UPI001BE1267D|nr:synaptic vesicle 2-related protein isoform X1 [Coregonus clupeaformis]
MSNWGKTSKISYQQWRNPEISVVTFRGTGGDSLCHDDEDQCGDYEVYTTGMQTVDLGERSTGPHVSHNSPTEDTFTVEDAVEAIGFGKFQWKLSILTGLSWMADAMEMMILSIISPQLHCEWRLPSWKVAMLTAVVFIGMMFSSTLWGNISDKYGRKVGLTMCMVWVLYYGFLSAFSPAYGWVLVLRGLVGFGIGGAPQSVTLYSEFLPRKSRATCIMLIEIFWALGAVFEVLLAIWIMPTMGWRWLLGLSTAPLVVFVTLCFWLPESPRFDVLSGNRKNAMKTLRLIAANNGKSMPVGELIDNKHEEDRGRIRDLLTPQYRRTTLLLWFIWFVNAFSYYGLVLLTTELFQAGDACGAITQGAKTEPKCELECKYLTLDDYKDLLWTTLAEFPGLFLTLFVIDRIGRKKSMAMCFLMFSVCILPLYACVGRVALTVFIFIARAFITGGFQVAYVYTPEVYPTATRALGIGTCSGMARVGALLTPFVAQVLLKKSVYLTLSVYCIFCLLATGASMLLPIETTGLGLQESSRITAGQEEMETGQMSNSSDDSPTHTSYGSSYNS